MSDATTSVTERVSGFLSELTNPLEWGSVDKCLLACVGLMPFIVFYAMWAEFAFDTPQLAQFIHPAVAEQIRWLFWLRLGGWVALFALSLWLRRRRQDSAVLVYAVSLYFSISTMAYAYWFEPYVTPFMVSFFGGAMVGFMLFEVKPMVVALASGVLVRVGMLFAERWGWLRPAPLFRHNAFNGEVTPSAWFFPIDGGTLLSSAVAFGAIVLIIGAWRAREEEFRALSLTDPLTRLANRRQFLLALEKEVARARRLERPVALLMCDADHFKWVNDTYGHAVGDEVLRQIAGVLIDCVRNGIDTPARVGGEEFAVLLSETDLNGARILAERIRHAVGALSFVRNGRAFNVTLSIGATFHEGERLDGESLLEAADSLLYRAKRLGRDRTESATLEQLVSPRAVG